MKQSEIRRFLYGDTKTTAADAIPKIEYSKYTPLTIKEEIKLMWDTPGEGSRVCYDSFYGANPYAKADDPFVPKLYKVIVSDADIVTINLDEWDGDVESTTKLIANHYYKGVMDAGIYNKIKHELKKARDIKLKGAAMNLKNSDNYSYEPYVPRKIYKPKRVIFSGPCTIILWADGTKTVVHCSDGDKFDEETGIAMCYLKKLLGNEGNYYNYIKKAKKMAVNGAKNMEE